MKTVYLKDGRMADLITQTEKGYLVDPYISWNDYEGQLESAPSGQVELVDKIYDTAPVEFIEAEYKKILNKVVEQERIWHERNNDIQKYQSEVTRLKNQKTDLERYIINREELRTAKRLILWPDSQIEPRIMDGTESHKFTLSYEISQYRNEERAWCYKGHTDKEGGGWSSYSEYFDQKLGIKVNLTDEEIFAITIDRIPRFKKDYHSWKHALIRTPDKWLTPEYIAEKQVIKEQFRVEELEKAKKELKSAQEKVEKLSQTELTVS